MKATRPTNLGFALLGLLHQGPMSGYDLRKVFAETALGNYSSSPGAIYPALKRLEKQRLIDGTEDRAKSLRPRKLYTPTGKGREVFHDWLSQDVTREDVSLRFHELMLRFAFHGVLNSTRATRDFLSGLAREADRYVEELKGQRKVFPEGAPVHSRLALEAGIEQYRASVRWARMALQHFEEEGR